jgi:diguanylate cyclase (GGDEF)-like protein
VERILDAFNEINDTFCHQCADEVLRQVAQRLRRIRGTDEDSAGLVARLGGDEFALLVSARTAAAAVSAAQEVRAALSTPYEVCGYTLDVSACIGVALYPAHGADADTLLRRADVAMYVAKVGGVG